MDRRHTFVVLTKIYGTIITVFALSPKNGEIMVLKYTYQSDKCKLEAYQSYTLAQNSNMSNTIVITSTDPNASKYKYYLEFVCYNYRGVPKKQYVSPLLEYAQEGIVFAVPANLTEYKGCVYMQITGYSDEDKTLLFKSVNKGIKAFDVEGSLNVVESEFANLPNLFTEFLDELKLYREQREDLLKNIESYKLQCDEAIQSVREDIQTYREQCDGVIQSARDDIQTYRGQCNNVIQSAREDIQTYRGQCDNVIQSAMIDLETYRGQCDGVIQTALDSVESAKDKFDSMVGNVFDEVKDSVGVVIEDLVNEKVKNDVFYKVTFKIEGETVKSIIISGGLKIQPPEYTLPSGCEVIGGWYELDKDRLWNFEEDIVNKDVELSLNFMSTGVLFNPNGRVKDLGNITGDVYLPDYYNGRRVTHTESAVMNIADNVNVHFGHFISYYVGIIAPAGKMKNFCVPKDGNFIFRKNCIYTDLYKLGTDAIAFVPRENIPTVTVQPGCQQIAMYAISNNYNIKNLVIPPTVLSLNNYAVMGTGITSVRLPVSVQTVSNYCFYNNVDLTDIYIESDLSEKVLPNTFLDVTVTPNRRPTLHVHAEHYAKYIERRLDEYYTIKVMGKEYYDEKYAPKEN